MNPFQFLDVCSQPVIASKPNVFIQAVNEMAEEQKLSPEEKKKNHEDCLRRNADQFERRLKREAQAARYWQHIDANKTINGVPYPEYMNNREDLERCWDDQKEDPTNGWGKPVALQSSNQGYVSSSGPIYHTWNESRVNSDQNARHSAFRKK